MPEAEDLQSFGPDLGWGPSVAGFLLLRPEQTQHLSGHQQQGQHGHMLLGPVHLVEVFGEP